MAVGVVTGTTDCERLGTRAYIAIAAIVAPPVNAGWRLYPREVVVEFQRLHDAFEPVDTAVRVCIRSELDQYVE